jgi:D-aminopeptidase
MSHTHTTNIRIAVDGIPITENHHCAWTAAMPVLGVTGDAALAPQLSGALAGTPFLATKRSIDRPTASRLFPDSSSRDQSIKHFATRTVQRWRERHAPALPASFTLSVSLDPSLANRAAGQHGWRQTSAAVLMVEVADWHREARPALGAALAAANRVWEPHGPIFEIGSEEAMRAQDPAGLARAQDFLNAWMHAEEADWLV